jgi:hypothetical protein
MQIEFEDIGQLQAWLASRQIKLSQWGSGGTKSLAHLWDEYVNGEVRFEDEPPLRVVQVVQVIIRRGDRILLEVEQEYSDGRRRTRNRPPSEKLKAGESHMEAAQRCLEEELGLGVSEMTFIDAAGNQEVQVTIESPSFPGLTTRYTLYTVEATVTGLPGSDFWLENRSSEEGDPIRRHRWAWGRSGEC